MRQYPKIRIPLDHLIIEPINILHQKLLIALEEKPNLILQLRHVNFPIPGSASIYFLTDMLVFLLRLILQEEADEAFEFVLDLPAAHQGAFVAVLLRETAFVAVLGGFDKLAAVAVYWLLEFGRGSLLSESGVFLRLLGFFLVLVLHSLLWDALTCVVLFSIVGVIPASGWHPLIRLYDIWFIVANRVGLTCLSAYSRPFSFPQSRFLLLWR